VWACLKTSPVFSFSFVYLPDFWILCFCKQQTKPPPLPCTRESFFFFLLCSQDGFYAVQLFTFGRLNGRLFCNRLRTLFALPPPPPPFFWMARGSPPLSSSRGAFQFIDTGQSYVRLRLRFLFSWPVIFSFGIVFL